MSLRRLIPFLALANGVSLPPMAAQEAQEASEVTVTGNGDHPHRWSRNGSGERGAGSRARALPSAADAAEPLQCPLEADQSADECVVAGVRVGGVFGGNGVV